MFSLHIHAYFYICLKNLKLGFPVNLKAYGPHGVHLLGDKGFVLVESIWCAWCGLLIRMQLLRYFF